MLKSQPEKRLCEEVSQVLDRYASYELKRTSFQWVRFYCAEVLLALEYLHSCGFIYRLFTNPSFSFASVRYNPFSPIATPF